MDYEKDMEIDETALDVEWLEQPRKTMAYGKNVALAELLSAKAKENLEYVKANLDKQIREDLQEMGMIVLYLMHTISVLGVQQKDWPNWCMGLHQTLNWINVKALLNLIG